MSLQYYIRTFDLLQSTVIAGNVAEYISGSDRVSNNSGFVETLVDIHKGFTGDEVKEPLL